MQILVEKKKEIHAKKKKTIFLVFILFLYLLFWSEVWKLNFD